MLDRRPSSPGKKQGKLVMYTGTLIQDLYEAVERAERVAKAAQSKNRELSEASAADATSKAEQLPQALGLSTTDGDLALLLIVHPQLVGTLEPRHDLADPVDVDQIRAMGPPENVGV